MTDVDWGEAAAVNERPSPPPNYALALAIERLRNWAPDDLRLLADDLEVMQKTVWDTVGRRQVVGLLLIAADEHGEIVFVPASE